MAVEECPSIVTRTPQIEAEMTEQGYAVLNARSRYASVKRYLLPYDIALDHPYLWPGDPLFIWHYMHKSVSERFPSIDIRSNRDDSGTFIEERQKTGSMLIEGEPMVHPETGQTGWSGRPDDYPQGIIHG